MIYHVDSVQHDAYGPDFDLNVASAHGIDNNVNDLISAHVVSTGFHHYRSKLSTELLFNNVLLDFNCLESNSDVQ